jgi:dipeptide transport system ATP-binding protein
MSLLEISNLSVEFETRSGMFRAVDGVSLAVDPREIVAIVGESGSGKSVAMLAVMGLLPKTARIRAERLTFSGVDLLTLGGRQRRAIVGRHMAMIFQEPMTSLNPCFTVGFQIEETLRAHLKLDRSARRRRAIELLEQVGIPEPESRLSAYPHQLSGGMSQRVMIAIAIACGPKLLIADEPTTALDVTIQAQILDLLVKLRDHTGMALVLITHDMGVVAETSERVVVQYAGQQVELAVTADLFADPHHPYTHALLAALPERARERRLASIAGVVPGQHDRPKGCLFAPRCGFTLARCLVEPPVAASLALGRALCHMPLVDGQPTDMIFAGPESIDL